jgi:hypothetical protein
MSGWYDKGGELPSAWTVERNDTDLPEPVTTEDHVRYGLGYIRRRYGR